MPLWMMYGTGWSRRFGFVIREEEMETWMETWMGFANFLNRHSRLRSERRRGGCPMHGAGLRESRPRRKALRIGVSAVTVPVQVSHGCDLKHLNRVSLSLLSLLFYSA